MKFIKNSLKFSRFTEIFIRLMVIGDFEGYLINTTDTIKKIPKKDIIIMHGDRNATIGADAYNNWAGTASKIGLGDTNERGLRLLDLVDNPIAVNSLHPHRVSRRCTWISPDGHTKNQIDYIIMQKR